MGRGLDGNTHAPVVSLADRFFCNPMCHQTLGAFFIRSMLILNRELGNIFVRLNGYLLTIDFVKYSPMPQDTPGNSGKLVGKSNSQLVLVHSICGTL